MGGGDHNRILSAAARRILRPEGFHQKGRSRTWLRDGRWYVVVVEFQPSSADVGTYLNVGACFLWSSRDHLSLDLGYRVEPFHAFESEAQFKQVAERLSARAVQVAAGLDSRLSSFSAAVVATEGPQAAWPLFHHGILLALAGQVEGARECLQRVAAETPSDAPRWRQALAENAASFLARIDDSEALMHVLTDEIMAGRAALGLEPIEDPLESQA